MTNLEGSVRAVLSMALMIGTAHAAEYPILEAPPGLTQVGRNDYASFLEMNLPRAMAIGSNGAYGWYSSVTSLDDARAKALQSCANKGASDCRTYAEDLQVIASPVSIGSPPATLIQGGSYAIVPDSRYFWRGPARARGIDVWGHGKSGWTDSRGIEPQAHVRIFNNVGFDVVRFDRDPQRDYTDLARDWLRDSAHQLRAMGYKQIVVGGQSRGAWNALQTLAVPGLVDGIVAISPASLNYAQAYMQRAELQRLLGDANSPNAKVVVVEFAGDGYAGDIAQRATDVRQALQGRVASMLLIDQPPGYSGHGAGASPKFALEYGQRIYRFIESTERSSSP